jgi:hypothetical protein
MEHPGPEDVEVIGYVGGVQSQAIAIFWLALTLLKL